MKHVIAILALCLASCTSTDKQSSNGRVGADAEAGPGGMSLAPFPFTPEAIRSRCVEGLELTFRVVAKGEQPVIQRIRFHDWSQEAVSVEIRRETPKGVLIESPTDTRSTWSEWRDHARFPSAATVRLRERAKTPSGEWDCWVYVVVGPNGGTTRFWFADQLPGPPVILDQEQDGDKIMRMELIAIHLP